MTARETFLIEMYRAVWENINRHILVVWQSVAALLAAAVGAYLSEKLVSPDIATSFVLLACAWLIAHCIDASNWYNRNLLIVANIERQFLNASDQREIHPYIWRHRKAAPIEHIAIQIALGIGIAALAVYQHFMKRMMTTPNFDSAIALPYALVLVLGVVLGLYYRKVSKSYATLVQLAPGKAKEEVAIPST